MPSHKPILVTGAAGFVGSAIVDHLIRSERPVRATTRSAKTPVHQAAKSVIVPDIADIADYSAALKGIDCIIHCAARVHVLRDAASVPLAEFRRVNTQATLDLAKAAGQSGVRRFIFLSSIAVNGMDSGTRPFRHDDAPNPQSPDAIAKWEAEQGLMEIARSTGLEVVIIRPPLVLGRGAKGNLGLMAALMRKGLPMPLGMITQNRRDLVSRDTLAGFAVHCIDHPAASGQIFLISDGAALSSRGLAECIAQCEGLRPRFLPLPGWLLRLALTIVGRRTMAQQLLDNLELDIDHSCTVLDWNSCRQEQSGKLTS